MFASKRILALDIGSHHLTLGEFSISSGTNPELRNYVIDPLGTEPGNEAARGEAVGEGVRRILSSARIKPAPLLMSISGQVVFPRFVKLPPVGGERIQQIVQYEAEQNVPFPIDEVVWDYLLIDAGDGERNAMLVAVKSEIVEELTEAVESAGLEPDVVDVAPLALYNAVCHNYESDDGCTIILDIGARSTNLVFVEHPRVFSRSIPVAGYAITQELMKEFNISYADAEDLKIERGAVAQGGAVGGSGDAVTDQVMKTIRSVMTRLHAEVNRSINFYRSQQGGSAPERAFIAGGSSVIPEMDTFFAEKLQIEVDFLNPFRNVTVAESIDTNAVQNDLHLLGEIVGLALRRTDKCASEINLMPHDLVARKRFRSRVPFFALSAVCVVLAILCWWGHFNRLTESLQTRKKAAEDKKSKIVHGEQLLNEARKTSAKAKNKANILVELVDGRTQWIRIVEEIRGLLLDGMWLSEIRPETGTNRSSIESIMILGFGFEDRLRDYNTPEANPIEFFRDKLAASPLFKVASHSASLDYSFEMVMDEAARQFYIRIGLVEPIMFR